MCCQFILFAQQWQFGHPFEIKSKGYLETSLAFADSGKYMVSLYNASNLNTVLIDSNLNPESQFNSEINLHLAPDILFQFPYDLGWIQILSKNASINAHQLELQYLMDGNIVYAKEIILLQNRLVPKSNLHYFRTNEFVNIWFQWQKPRGDNAQITLIAFDLKLGEFTTQHVLPNVANELLKVEQVTKLSGENWAILSKIFEVSQKERRGGKVNYSYCLFQFDADSERLISHQLSNDNSFCSKLRILHSDSAIVYAYFTSDKGSKFADTLRLCSYNLQAHLFTRLLNQPMACLEIDKSWDYFHPVKKRIQNLWIDAVLEHENGYTIVMEYYVAKILGGLGNQSLLSYNYGPLLVLHLDYSGHLIWFNQVYKLQVSENDRAAFSSYKFIQTPEAYKIYFNESAKPHKKRNWLGGKHTLNQRSNLVEQIVFTNGNNSRKIVRDNNDDCGIPLIESSLVLPRGDVVMLMKLGDTFRIAKLHMN